MRVGLVESGALLTIVLIAVVAFSILVLPAYYDWLAAFDSAPSAHAIERHGAQLNLQSVVDACNAGRAQAMRLNPTTNRLACVVYQDSVWAVAIFDAMTGDNITIFPKEKMGSLEAVLHYLENTGYTSLLP